MALGGLFNKLFDNNKNTPEPINTPPEDIPVTRENIARVEERVILAKHSTLILCGNGTIQSTKVLDDKYGIYDGGVSQATAWRNIASVMFYDGINSRIIGADTSGKIHITTNKEHQLDDDTLVGSLISSWNDIKTFKSKTMSILAIRNDGDVYIYDKGLSRNINATKLPGVHDVSELLIEAPMRVFKCFDGHLLVIPLDPNKKNYGFFEEANTWNNVKSIFYASGRAIGLKEDGTLIASRYAGQEIADALNELYIKGIFSEPQLPPHDFWDEISSWENIVDLIDYGNCVVGLTGDGEIFFTEIANDHPSINSSVDIEQIRDWYGIAKLYLGYGMIVGLRFDGSVICTQCSPDDSLYFPGKNSISNWNDIIGLKFGISRSVGIKKDGSLVAVGDNSHGATNVDNMRMFRSFSEIL